MFLEISEREHHLLVDLLGSALHALHESDATCYGPFLTQRESLMRDLHQRLRAAEASGLLVGEPESRHVTV